MVNKKPLIKNTLLCSIAERIKNNSKRIRNYSCHLTVIQLIGQLSSEHLKTNHPRWYLNESIDSELFENFQKCYKGKINQLSINDRTINLFRFHCLYRSPALQSPFAVVNVVFVVVSILSRNCQCGNRMFEVMFTPTPSNWHFVCSERNVSHEQEVEQWIAREIFCSRQFERRRFLASQMHVVSFQVVIYCAVI